jgi:site-specific DNA-methyltransferase (adenine-specific)
MKNIVYNCDCNYFMKYTRDKVFDFAIPDPPYGIGESKIKSSRWENRKDPRNGRPILIKKQPYKSKNWDNKPPDSNYFKELFRVSQNQIIFGGNYFKEIIKPFKPIRRNKYNNFLNNNPYQWIIWDKVNGDSDNNDCEMIWTSLKIKSEIIYYMWCGFLQGISVKKGKINQGNKKKCEKRIHPTQKPVIFYKWLFLKFIKSGMIILDTNIGSGSSRIAAYDLGIDFVGCEKDEEIWQAQEVRFQNHIAHNELFDKQEMQKYIYQEVL